MTWLLAGLLATIGAHEPKMSTMLGTDAALECPFAAGVTCERRDAADIQVTTTRAGGATCGMGGSVGANTACVGAFGLECFLSGVGGRTAADVHTVPSAGFPVASGEVRLQYAPIDASPGVARFLLSAEQFGVAGWSVYLGSTNNIIFIVANGSGGSVSFASPVLAWVGCDPSSTTCVPYDIRVRWGGGSTHMWRDGALVYEGTGQMPLGPLPANAAIGGRSPTGSSPANGQIRLVRVGG